MKSPANQSSLRYLNADAVVRANYQRILQNSTVVNATEEYIPAINMSVVTIRYRNGGTMGEYEVTTQVTGDGSGVKVLGIDASKGVNKTENTYFSVVPLWTYVKNTDYNIRAADALIRRFTYLNFGSSRQKNFSVQSIFNSLSSTSDQNRYFFNQLIDGTPF